MGMFDYLIINAEKLPVSSEEKAILKNRVFQTKSLNKGLLSYVITNEDELIIQYIKGEESVPYWRGVSGHDSEFVSDRDDFLSVKEPFHGLLVFYTNIDNTWFEFEAKFTDGKMVAIERIHERSDLHK